jgi:hypothetical protein
MMTMMIPRRISTESSRGGFDNGSEANGVSTVGATFPCPLAVGRAAMVSPDSDFPDTGDIFTSFWKRTVGVSPRQKFCKAKDPHQ